MERIDPQAELALLAALRRRAAGGGAGPERLARGAGERRAAGRGPARTDPPQAAAASTSSRAVSPFGDGERSPSSPESWTRRCRAARRGYAPSNRSPDTPGRSLRPPRRTCARSGALASRPSSRCRRWRSSSAVSIRPRGRPRRACWCTLEPMCASIPSPSDHTKICGQPPPNLWTPVGLFPSSAWYTARGRTLRCPASLRLIRGGSRR